MEPETPAAVPEVAEAVVEAFAAADLVGHIEVRAPGVVVQPVLAIAIPLNTIAETMLWRRIRLEVVKA